MSMLADIDTYQRRPESALILGQQSLAAFQTLGDPVGIATCLSRIGFAYMNMGEVGQARRVVSQSARLFAELGAQRDQVIAQAFLCAIELMAGDYAAAHRFAQQSLEIALALDDQFVQGVALSFLVWTQIYTASPQVALPTLRQAVAVTEHTGAASDLARASALLAFAAWKSGLCDDALTYCLQSLRLSSQVADPWGLLTALSAAIAILADRGQSHRAMELYNMLLNDPLCAASCWFRDSIGASVAAARAQLPEPMVDAALFAEQTLDQQKTAAQLVGEIQALKQVFLYNPSR
jgi:tetratricopeptide (TPR) repeat protein